MMIPKKKPNWTRGGLKGRLSGILKNLQGVCDEHKLLTTAEHYRVAAAKRYISEVLDQWEN